MVDDVHTRLVNEMVVDLSQNDTNMRCVLLQDKLYVLLDIPKAGDYRLLVKYTYEGRDAVHTQVTVQFKNTSEAGEFFNFSATLQECNNCPATINEQYVLLRKGLWMVNVTTPQQSDQLKLVNRCFYTFVINVGIFFSYHNSR